MYPEYDSSAPARSAKVLPGREPTVLASSQHCPKSRYFFGSVGFFGVPSCQPALVSGLETVCLTLGPTALLWDFSRSLTVLLFKPQSNFCIRVRLRWRLVSLPLDTQASSAPRGQGCPLLLGTGSTPFPTAGWPRLCGPPPGSSGAPLTAVCPSGNVTQPSLWSL